MKNKDNTKRTPIVLQSAAPIDDCGRRWNKIYWICAAAGAILGFLNNGFGPLCGCALLGLLVGWVVKSFICRIKAQDFRKLRFSVSRQMPYPELTTKLVAALTPLGMSVENSADGSISIAYKKMIYDVSYEDEATFSVWWRVNIARALLGTAETVGTYRKISQATGIIAWNIQQICNANKNSADAVNSAETGGVATAVYTSSDQSCGVEKRPKKGFVKPLLIVIVVVALFLVGKGLLTDDSMGIADMTFEDMTYSMGDAVGRKPFCDAEWSNDGESTVLLTFNDQSANAYEIWFSLFDNDTQARIDTAYINDVSFDDIELTYLLDYLDTGDYDEFKSMLSAYAIVSNILF